MQIIVMFGLLLTAISVVFLMRRSRDRQDMAERIAQKGGRVVKIQRRTRNTPFAITPRGGWVWLVAWQDSSGSHTAWVITTREGIKEWQE